MSAEHWNAAGIREMLTLTGGQISPRKLRLFNLWCCEVLQPYLRDRRSQIAAQYADEHADDCAQYSAERARMRRAAHRAVAELHQWAQSAPTAAELRRRRTYVFAAQVAQQTVGNELPNCGVLSNAKYTSYAFAWANDDFSVTRGDGHAVTEQLLESHLRVQANMFREIVGNPFLPAAFDARWRTSDVVGLARGIYIDRAFDRMPILSDALMDAGCDDESLLDHCRLPSSHVRGCWAIDLILGKV